MWPLRVPWLITVLSGLKTFKRTRDQPVGHDPLWGRISNIYIMVHELAKSQFRSRQEMIVWLGVTIAWGNCIRKVENQWSDAAGSWQPSERQPSLLAVAPVKHSAVCFLKHHGENLKTRMICFCLSSSKSWSSPISSCMSLQLLVFQKVLVRGRER